MKLICVSQYQQIRMGQSLKIPHAKWSRVILSIDQDTSEIIHLEWVQDLQRNISWHVLGNGREDSWTGKYPWPSNTPLNKATVIQIRRIQLDNASSAYVTVNHQKGRTIACVVCVHLECGWFLTGMRYSWRKSRQFILEPSWIYGHCGLSPQQLQPCEKNSTGTGLMETDIPYLHWTYVCTTYILQGLWKKTFHVLLVTFPQRDHTS